MCATDNIFVLLETFQLCKCSFLTSNYLAFLVYFINMAPDMQYNYQDNCDAIFLLQSSVS